MSRFIARDVRREIKIISIDGIDDGLIVGQVRTNNILYLSKKLDAEQEFSDPTTLEISQMWKWTGQPWGGLPDGTSITDQIKEKR